ncbi:kinase-like domain-containing protein [Rhizophagus clarus]|uniref:Kinase-like domain-containing protein n=1 Tax=Rhizophagus clarus TaxID=94130 RepID=A0A8H3LM14_9GLOM|nr:kinase-like domain-containing protein [Rhizophagus clarus]
MDQFISKNSLKWIPYDKFKNIEYLDKGGFSTIYKATYNNKEIVLKCFSYLNNSDESLREFLNEWKIIYSPWAVINIFGFTKNPNTLDYMLIMEYANEGNLRKCLTEVTLTWKQKLFMLYKILASLNTIHGKNLIHYDFHDGNILCIKYQILSIKYQNIRDIYGSYISDYLGSYQSATSFLENIYGVIPFIAPEVLRGKPYTPASERPEINENTPQWYIDLMKECWDVDPLKRPSASKIIYIIEKWIGTFDDDEFINAPIRHLTVSHPQAYYSSRLLNFTSRELNRILEEYQEFDIFREFFKLENIAETYYQYSRNVLKEKQMELDASQHKNSQFEQDIQNLNLVLEENTLQAQIDNLTKQLEQSKLEFQIQINQLNQENNNLQVQLAQKETNVQEHKNQLIQFQNSNKQVEDENLKLKGKLKEIKIELDLQQRNSKLQEQKIDHLQQSMKLTEEENDNLCQKNANLINQLENLFQQDSLSDDKLSNYQLEYSYQNYGMNLNNDISSLNNNLKNYVTDLNQDVIVNIEEIKKLLLLYKCPAKILSQRDDQLLIQAVLQRHIIETIISHATKYFQSTGQHYHLESDITYEHPFIADCKKKLNNTTNELRIVKDQEKIVVENLAATIICEFIKLFWFRPKIHEPVVQYVWIPSNVKVDKRFMKKNNFDDIDDDENLYVDLCYFPLIGNDLTSNNQKVYIPAKVIVRKN